MGSPGTANFSAINGSIEVGGKIDTTNSLFFNSMAVNLKNNSYIHAASLNAVAAGTSYLINLDAGTSVIDTTGYVGFLAGSGALTVRRSFGVTDAVLSLTGTSTTRELNGIGATVENNVRIDSNTNLKVNSYGIGGDTTVFGTLNAAGNITVSSAEGTVDFQGKSTATGDVTLTTSGLATGSIINSGDIVSAANIFINSSGFDFDHTGGKLAAAGSITAMVGSGNIDIGADVTAASIDLTAQNIHHSNGKFSASGAVILSAMGGDITQSVTAPRVEGGTVTLSALTGSVGVGNVFKTMTPNLDINANGALIDNLGDTKLNYLGGLSNSSFYNDGNITITGAFASGGALSFSANGNINTSGVISNLSDISILSTAANGSIQIGDGTGPDDILTTGNLTLNATGSGTITTDGLASLNAQQVSLIAPAGAIGTQALPILTSANKLLTDASGDVFLQNSGPVTVLSSRAGTKFDLQNTGKVTVAGGIQAVDTSISTIGIGDIIINTGSPLASSSLTLNVLGFGAISAARPVAAAPALQLFSAFGDIGSAGNPIDVSASTLTANTLNGSVYILDRQAVNLGSSSAGSIGTFHLIAPGITTTGNVNAQNVLLETPLLNNDFLLQATGTVSILSTTGSLLVQGSGALSSAGPITFSSIASVNVTQTSIQDLAGGPGVVTGNAPGFFSVTSNSGFNASNIAGGAGVKLSSLSGNLNASQITSGGPMDLLTAAGSLTATALSASGNMLLTSAGGDLIVNGKLDANGTILLSSGNGLTLNAPVINSTGVLSLTANNDISINGGVLSTGSISKSVNKLSTNMADFDYSAIVTPGGVTIRSNNGKIATGPVQITSYGASISFAAPGAISIGTGSNLFAQGGNITINSWTDDVMVGGFSTFQAVARSIIPSAPMTIDGQQINQFVGGDIGIDVDINVASQYGSYDNFLRTFDLNRVVNGNVPNGTLNVVGPNINNMAGTTMNITNSGMVDIRTTGTATAIGSISFGNGTKLNTDGGVIQIDPVNSDVVIGPNVAFNAFGPNLLGGGVFILPPPPPAGNNQPIQPPPLPPLFAALPGIIAGGAGGGGGGGGGGAVAGPGAGGPVTPVDVVNPVAQVPVVAPVPPPAIQTDVIVLSTNEEKQQEKKEATFATRSTELDYFVPITYVGTAPCQQFLIAGKRRGDLQCVTVVASRGTVLGTVKSPEEKQSFASRLLSLKEGKIVVVSGQKSGMKLDVSDATLNLPVGSVAVVHRKASGAMRVSMVSGGTVSVAIKGAGGDQVMTAAPGEEIAIGGSEEELIAADGIERQLISAKMIMTVDGDDGKADDMLKGGVSTSAIGTTTASNLKPGKRNLRVEKRSFDREKMSEGENLLACLDCAKIGCSSSMCRLQRTHFTQPKTKTKKLTASSQKQIAEARDAHVFSPVAYKISLQPPTAAPVLSTLQLGTAIVKHAGSAHITSMEKSVITANQGEVLVCSSKPTVVKAGNALVECSPGSPMLINTTPQSISVSSLWQDGAVTVHAGTRNYKMHPGEECIIAGSNQTQKAMQTNAAARRNVRSFSVGASQPVNVCIGNFAGVSVPYKPGASTTTP